MKPSEAVELVFFQGLSQATAAQRLGISQQAISRRLYGVRRNGSTVGGALKRLRPRLEALVVKS